MNFLKKLVNPFIRRKGKDMGTENKPTLVSVLGHTELMEELSEAIEVCLGSMIEDGKITQEQYDKAAPILAEGLGLYLTPVEKAPPEVSEEEEEQPVTPTRRESRELREKIKARLAKEQNTPTPNLGDAEEEDEDSFVVPSKEEAETNKQTLKGLKQEKGYPERAEENVQERGTPATFEAPDFFEWKGVKYTTPNWAKQGSKKSFKSFKNSVKTGKAKKLVVWPEKYPENVVIKKDSVIHATPAKEKNVAPSHIPQVTQKVAPPPSKERRQEIKAKLREANERRQEEARLKAEEVRAEQQKQHTKEEVLDTPEHSVDYYDDDDEGIPIKAA